MHMYVYDILIFNSCALQIYAHTTAPPKRSKSNSSVQGGAPPVYMCIYIYVRVCVCYSVS